jgi:3-hydroxy-9,10-secoandrosta-1,3,5(10)-triene-9,17-dione monooxygenase reductase component
MQIYRMQVDADTFRSLMGRFATGVTVVTFVDTAGRDCGITLTAFASLSLTPPLILVCVDRTASVYPMLRTAQTFAVNILSERQEMVARRFAATGEDRFDGIGFARGATGAPLLDEAIVALECRKVEMLEGGDHSIFLGEVESGAIRQRGEIGSDMPLLYYRGGYTQLER